MLHLKESTLSVGGGRGLTEGKISRLDASRTDSAFNERERMALEFAENLAVDHFSLDDDFFRRMRLHFSDAEGLKKMTSRHLCGVVRRE